MVVILKCFNLFVIAFLLVAFHYSNSLANNNSIKLTQTHEETISIDGNQMLREFIENNDYFGEGTLSDPYKISGLNLIGNLSTPNVLLSITGTTDYIEISDSRFSSGNVGILINNSSNVVIKNNDFNLTTTSIMVETSSNIMIQKNIISMPNTGIFVLKSENVILVQNQISKAMETNSIGVLVQSNFTKIVSNIISDITGDGILIDNSEDTGEAEKLSYFTEVVGNVVFNNNKGIHAYAGRNSTIIGNNVSHNLGWGINSFSDADISQNEIHYNNNFGLILHGVPSINNSITMNNLISNIPGIYQENVDGFYVPKEGSSQSTTSYDLLWDPYNISGNYWDDMIGIDDNQDGFYDSPYLIDGESLDIKPLTNRTMIDQMEIVENFYPGLLLSESTIANTIDQEISFIEDEDLFGIPGANFILVTGIGIIFIVGSGTFVILYRAKTFGSKKVIGEYLVEIFGKNSPLIPVLLNVKRNNREIDSDLISEEIIPKELFKFKFLLHPVRLAIMKLIIRHSTHLTIEIRNQLDITRSDLAFHISALKEHGYIDTHDGFVDGQVRKIVTLLPEGETSFLELEDVIKKVFD